jgi:hypothetical protein
MTNQQKAALYDELIRESDALQRENSRLKSQYVTNIPPEVQAVLDKNNKRIAILVGQFENLLR